ncbi:MAG: hypothetical protein FJ028_01860 [Chloroflexi bacterium]|nr:hypothetical protein [Chloroflexota bacterium]
MLALAIFFAVAAVTLLSFAGAWLVVSGAGRAVADADEPTAAPVAARPGRTAAAATAATLGDRVRVRGASARSRPIDTGARHEVTFIWTLEGARENDPAVVQFYVGTRALGQQRGTLDPGVFNFSTGTLTLTTSLECSTSGWTAELLTVRGHPVVGDGEAAAPGVQCR